MSSCPTRLLGLAPASSGNDALSMRRSHDLDELAASLGQPGSTIANYEVVKQIGEGGMGRVFEVWHPQLRKSFALKLLVERLEHDAAAVERFQSETLALGQLEHVNIVSAVDAGTWQGRPFLVTQFLQGTDLATHVANQGPFGLEQTRQLALQILRGMQAAHAVKLYHRDIKPSNLFLETNGTIKLLDFGLVRSSACESMTQTGCLMGSVDFLSPEQAHDPRSVDARSDIYSLGCTLIFLLSGSAPFPDDSYPSLPAKLLAHSRHSPPWLDRVLVSDPHPLLWLIQRMLAKQPDNRPESAQEIIDGLEAIASPTSGQKSTNLALPGRRSNLRVASGVIVGAAMLLIATVAISGWGLVGSVRETPSPQPLTQLRLETPAVVSTTSGLNDEPTADDRETSSSEPATHRTLPAKQTQSALGPAFPSALTGPPRSVTFDDSPKFGSKPD